MTRLLSVAVLIGLSFPVLISGSCKAADPPVDFNRQVLPILSENCFACHGPDAKTRKARLRLDNKEGAFAELRSGGFALVPGKPAESELIERITSDDDHLLMPPAKSGKKLKANEIDILRRWVAQGATWKPHWAFVPPHRPKIPATNIPTKNPIDAFVFSRLEKEGLKPAPEADRVTLIRRVTLDLTGLPPTPPEVEAFLNDTSPTAYEKVVDRLLASPRFGEHRARYWLDAARYGDTHGLHLDNYREIWPYRDWVINAFNANKPFDQFVIEQVAGDLLPHATRDQLVATGFNRCNVSTSEGGSIEEEVYVRNVVDRVDTTGTVFLGLSVGCARCHDHKFDPVTQKDYYSLFAFFNSIDGPALDGNIARHAPVIPVASPEQLKELEQAKARVATARKAIETAVAKVDYNPANDDREPAMKATDFVWIEDGLPAGAEPQVAGINGKWHFAGQPKHPVHSGKESVVHKADGLGQLVFQNAAPPLTVGTGDKLFAYVYLDPENPPEQVMLQWHSAGWLHRAYWGANKIDWGRDNSPERLRIGDLPEPGTWVRLEVEAARVGLKPGTHISGWAFTQFGGKVYWDRAGIVTRTPQGTQSFNTLEAWIRAQRATNGAGLPKPIQALVKMPVAKRSKDQTKELRDYFVAHALAGTRPTFDPLLKTLKDAESVVEKLDKAIPATMVFKEAKERKTAHILKRGEYDQKGEKVDRATPAFLPPMPTDAPRDRLGLARWMVAAENPLTARTAVNRFWQSVFGTGLVKTADDFGSQGEPPSHPELLDWLAVEFRESGWDVKKFLKLMVLSATYRQSAALTPEKLAKDRDNRLLSRGPRFRLDAESIRDQALFVSGLLVEKVGGPSVKPPQPAGLWEAVGYTSSNTAKFTADSGAEKVHRRSLYTFWKRTSSPPQMSIADAPSREMCVVRRERTNTPLQALLLMNETQFIECARSLAEKTLREGGDTPDTKLAYLFQQVTCRKPETAELVELRSALKDFQAVYAHDLKAARKLTATGETKPDPKLDPAELAAWTMIGNTVLNLDEVLNK